MKRFRTFKKGVILITVVGTISVITILVMALLQTSLANLNFAEKQVKTIVALNAAEAGIATAIYSLEEEFSGSTIESAVSTGVDYSVEIDNNLTGTSASGDVPAHAAKITSTGYVDKGKASEYRRTIVVLIRLKSLNLGLVSGGLLDLGKASSVSVSAVSGHSGNVHSNYNGDLNNNGTIDSGEKRSFDCVDLLHKSYGDYPPYYYISGKVSTPGYVHDNVKNGARGGAEEGPSVQGIDIPEWDIDTLMSGTYVPVGEGTYKVEDGKLKQFNDSGALVDGDVVTSIQEMVGAFYGTSSELYNVIPEAIVCNGSTMTIDIPDDCTCLDSVNLKCQGNMKVENSNFECLDKIEIAVTEDNPSSGNLTVSNTNFGGKATLMVEGKLTFEGYSNIEGSDSDGLALYAGGGMELHMKEGTNPVTGYDSSYHYYKGIIYSGGPIELYNEGARGLRVEGAVVANNVDDPNLAYIEYKEGAGYEDEYMSLRFTYNPDYTRNLIISPENSSTETEMRFDRVFWHIY